MYDGPISATYTIGGFTATAGTAIVALVPPAPPTRFGLSKFKKTFVKITTLDVTAGGTQHSILAFRPLGSTTVGTVAAAAQKNVVLAADPGAAPVGPSGAAAHTAASYVTAANWYYVFELPDGTYYYDFATGALTGTTVALNSNLPTGGIAAGAQVWLMGPLTGTLQKDPYSGLAAQTFTTVVSVRNTWQDSNGVVSSNNAYEPILLYDANATAADFINQVAILYSDR